MFCIEKEKERNNFEILDSRIQDNTQAGYLQNHICGRCCALYRCIAFLSLPMFYCFLLFLKQVFHYAVGDVLLFVGEELRFSNNESQRLDTVLFAELHCFKNRVSLALVTLYK